MLTTSLILKNSYFPALAGLVASAEQGRVVGGKEKRGKKTTGVHVPWRIAPCACPLSREIARLALSVSRIARTLVGKCRFEHRGLRVSRRMSLVKALFNPEEAVEGEESESEVIFSYRASYMAAQATLFLHCSKFISSFSKAPCLVTTPPVIIPS